MNPVRHKAETAAHKPSAPAAPQPRKTKEHVEAEVSKIEPPLPPTVIATHEAGHIVAAILLGHQVTRASIEADYHELLWGTVATRITDIDRMAGLVPNTPPVHVDPNWPRLARRRLVQILAGAAASRVAGHTISAANLAQDMGHAHQVARLIAFPGEDTKPIVDHFAAIAERILTAWWPVVEKARDALLRHRSLEGDRLSLVITELRRERNVQLFKQQLNDVRSDPALEAEVPHRPAQPPARVAPKAPSRLTRKNSGKPASFLPAPPRSMLDLDPDEHDKDAEPQVG